MNDKIYIARDPDGTLAIYASKPIYDKESETFANNDVIDYLSYDYYPEVTFENSPIELKPSL